jgi:hypothetical protein
VDERHPVHLGGTSGSRTGYGGCNGIIRSIRPDLGPI